jgi:phosphoglucosamine mutase
MVDASGRLYNGDELLYVLAVDRLEQGAALPGVVGTLMTNLGVERALRERGLEVVRAQVGDRYVLEELLARGWQLGGEGSGHLLSLDRHTTGDGIVSALMVLQAAVRSGRSARRAARKRAPLSADADQRPPEAGHGLAGEPALAERRAEVDRELGATGRVLIRPSGTEPLVRVMVEAEDAAQAKRCAERLAESLA